MPFLALFYDSQMEPPSSDQIVTMSFVGIGAFQATTGGWTEMPFFY